MYRLCFYVPVADAEKVKQAVFEAGAGQIGNYQSCCFQTLGQGQFKPLKGANPAIGEIEQLSVVDELKIEMVCSDGQIKAAVKAMLAAHPYEEPAYQCWRIQTLEDL